MEKENKRKDILDGIKKSLIYSLVAAAALGIIAAIYAFFAHKYLFKSIAYAYYYFGAVVSIFAVPQLWRRNEDSKLVKIRRQNPLFGFQSRFRNPYEEKAAEERAKEASSGGFWFGVFIIVFSICLFIYGVIMESIYFNIWG